MSFLQTPAWARVKSEWRAESIGWFAGSDPVGVGLVREAARFGLPVIAIGGITPERADELRAAGAYGVAAIGSLWRAPDPAAATLAMLTPWLEDS